MFFFIFIAWIGNPVSTSCVLELSPPRVVVRFGGSLSANCTSLSDQTDGIGWESPYDPVDLTNGVTSLPFKLDSVPDWEIGPICFVNLRDGDQCTKTLLVTVYKMPDSVSLRQNSSIVKEGQQYDIQCDIVNVAPARNLSVAWHKGNSIMKSETFDESSPSNISKSSVLNLTAHRDDDGAEIWCEAKLNLWPEEQGPSPLRSEAHIVTVLYSPTFISASDETLDFPADPPTFIDPLNKTLELSAGEKMTLNCNATGNPAPSYHWQFPQGTQEPYKSQDANHSILTRPLEFPGVYTCTASNTQGTVTKYFTVNKPPGIGPGATAGIVITVLAIAILGAVIWYKNR